MSVGLANVPGRERAAGLRLRRARGREMKHKATTFVCRGPGSSFLAYFVEGLSIQLAVPMVN